MVTNSTGRPPFLIREPYATKILSTVLARRTLDPYVVRVEIGDDGNPFRISWQETRCAFEAKEQSFVFCYREDCQKCEEVKRIILDYMEILANIKTRKSNGTRQ
jgi:hypothetical protein